MSRRDVQLPDARSYTELLFVTSRIPVVRRTPAFVALWYRGYPCLADNGRAFGTPTSGHRMPQVRILPGALAKRGYSSVVEYLWYQGDWSRRSNPSGPIWRPPISSQKPTRANISLRLSAEKVNILSRHFFIYRVIPDFATT